MESAAIKVWWLWATFTVVFIVGSADADWRILQVIVATPYTVNDGIYFPPVNAESGQAFAMDDTKYAKALREISRSPRCDGGRKYEGSYSPIQVKFAENQQFSNINAVICYDSNNQPFWVKKEGGDFVVYYK